MAVINYKGRKAVKNVVKITENEVITALLDAAAQCPVTVPVERKAQTGDIVDLDFAGFCEGKQFDGGTAQGYKLELGSGTFIPGFEEQLTGLKAGEEKDVNVTFPEKYAPNLAGKDAVFKCRINTVFEKTERKLDDAFAKEVFELPDLEALKKQTKERLEHQAEAEAANEALGNIMDAIIDDNPMPLEETKVREEIGNVIRAMMVQMTGEEMEFEEFYKLAGMTAEDFEEGLRPTAERNLQMQQIIRKIAEQEGIEATDEERMQQADIMAPQFGMTGKQLLEMVEKNAFDEDIIMQKTLTFIYENADLTENFVEA